MARRHRSTIGDLESVFLRLEELVLANSGEDEFDEVFKLVIARLWDERSQQPQRFVAHPSPRTTHEAVTELLREADQQWPGVLPRPNRPLLTPEHLQVCVEALAPHRLASQHFEVLDALFEYMVSRASKGAKGQFFTPRHVAELCVRMLRPTVEETVLDPACGSGGFLVQTLAAVAEASHLDAAGMSAYARAHVHGWDIDPRAVQVARALMALAGGAGATVRHRNSLVPVRREPTGFDVIVTNPPFAGEVREEGLLQGYELAHRRTRVERDVLFIERCVRLLRPGGRMAVLLPHSKFATPSFGPLRTWLLRHCRVIGVVGLGRNTFLPHTHQKAGVLVAVKRAEGDTGTDDEAIFFASSERDGKDARGHLVLRRSVDATLPLWDRVDHDLAEVVAGFHSFCADQRIALGR